MNKTLTTQLASLPQKPGIYHFSDASGRILYVGKAKRLRTRVQSYFRPSANLDPAKEEMVTKVASLDTIVCDSENEALILEATLIREHKPPYNVVLTDDKHYLFIKITKEEHPRVFPVRRRRRDGARYFGPFSSARAVRHTLKLLQRLFPHHTDKTPKSEWVFPHPLFTDTKATHQTTLAETNDNESYQHNINQIIRFLKGDRGEILTTLRRGMAEAANEHAYEKAAIFRNQLQALERLEGSQKVYTARTESFDIISIATEHTRSAANIFSIRQGKLLRKNTFLLRHHSNTLPADIIRQFILQYYADTEDIPRRIYTPLTLADEAAVAAWISQSHPPIISQPKRGLKKQLLHMGVSNAEQLLHEETLNATSQSVALAAAQDLYMQVTNTPREEVPTELRIETYDISNIQGSLATGSLVTFINGQPAKKYYKRFRIKHTTGPDDYAMLAEVLSRRFATRHDTWPLPHLIMIDGGKGQLSRSLATINKLGKNIPIISLAKQEELIFIPNHKEPLRLPYNSPTLFLVQRMRDEAHRFTITYHRHLRSHAQSRSVLDDIPGIGPKTKKILLAKLGSLRAIRTTSQTDLAKVVGKQKAALIHEYLADE